MYYNSVILTRGAVVNSKLFLSPSTNIFSLDCLSFLKITISKPQPMRKDTKLFAWLILGAIATGCATTATEPANLPTASVASPATPPTAPSPVVPSPQAAAASSEITLANAEDIATGAIAVTDTAITAEDWQMVASRWQRAIALLQAIPESDAKRAIAQEKIAAYQKNLTTAQQNAKSPPPPSSPPAAVAKTNRTTPPQQQSTTSVSSNVAQAQPQQPPTGDRLQSPQIALAQHLNRIGAKVYGTYWCGACKYQRDLFGQEAFTQIQEVECDPRGKNAQPDLCRQAGVRAYPTWQINGQNYEGARSLQELAQLSGYQGNLNF
jgi:glutaredoxin